MILNYLKSIYSQVRITFLRRYLTYGICNVVCPLCGWKGSSFASFGQTSRPNALCPQCFSLERHRLLYLFFKSHLNTTKKLKFLHFAPEKGITKLIKGFKNIHYVSVDRETNVAERVEDITNLSFKANSFDIIYCSHVLEHVQNDLKALNELYRVLRSTGYAIIQVPLLNQDKTYENNEIITEQERIKHFGQKDHVRSYGRDFVRRLKKSGFNVKIIDFASTFTPFEREKYSLIPHHKNPAPTEGYIYFCTK